MQKIRGWGLLLLITLVVLTMVAWNKTRHLKHVQDVRASEASLSAISSWMQSPFIQHFYAHHQVPKAGAKIAPMNDLPAYVKTWRLQPDGMLEIDVVNAPGVGTRTLRMLPIVSDRRRGFSYQFTGPLPPELKMMYGNVEWLSDSDIKRQLALNDERLRDPLASTSQVPRNVGVVLNWPANTAAGTLCTKRNGCVREQTCVNSRPLLCQSVTQAPKPTKSEHRATEFTTRAQADAACANDFGATWTVLRIHLTPHDLGPPHIQAEHEYWVHDPSLDGVNCWASA